MTKKLSLFILIFLFLFECYLTAAESSKYPDIVFPVENQSFPFISHSFIFGNTKPGSTVTVNGIDVKVHSNGAFLSFVPVEKGTFTFQVRSELNGNVFENKRTVKISGKLKSSLPDSKEIRSVFMEPSTSMVLNPGVKVIMRFMGTPGKSAFFRFKEEEMRFEMKEIEYKGYLGVYEGIYTFKEEFQKPKEIIFELFDKQNRIAIKECPNTILIKNFLFDDNYEVKENYVKARNYPDGGYRLLLYKGIRLKASGIIGPYIKLDLSDKENVYVNKKDITKVEKTGMLQDARIGNVKVLQDKDDIKIISACTRAVPYLVEEKISDSTLSITFFSAHANIDKVQNEHYKDIKNISFQQIDQDVLKMDVILPFQPIWGWDILFEKNKMILSIKRPPVIKKETPFKNMVICIDAGHNPGAGAVGPTRLKEKDINWDIASKISKILKKNGAKVVMTRKVKKDEASLRERVNFANSKKSRIFVSIHNNSVSNSVNPYDVFGTETYFYTPSSEILAEFVHNELVSATGFVDRGVHFGNFAVLRNPFLPSILIEAAYIIVPEHEMLLKKEEFQGHIATSIVNGLKMFLLKNAKVI
ncbi:MAG: N-acetylmuramoyl-L-alanine amidase [Candidatus Aureabacteria bacterium]|nr:N-acetylmuramoyl-L-alanine amidase [Candidatus Auribacterota bacterium]